MVSVPAEYSSIMPKRIAWLESKMPKDERKEVGARDKEVFDMFSGLISLDETNEPEASPEDAGTKEGCP